MDLNQNQNHENDWLIAEQANSRTKDAFVLMTSALIHLGKGTCTPPLSLDEIQAIVESVWYEMD